MGCNQHGHFNIRSRDIETRQCRDRNEIVRDLVSLLGDRHICHLTPRFRAPRREAEASTLEPLVGLHYSSTSTPPVFVTSSNEIVVRDFASVGRRSHKPLYCFKSGSAMEYLALGSCMR